MAADVIFSGIDTDRVPLTGLTPTWHACFNAETGIAITGGDRPVLEELVGGLYRAVAVPDAACGIIDLGDTAGIRYLLVESKTRVVFIAFLDGTPSALADHDWEAYRSASGGDEAPEFTNLGSGLYRIDDLPDDGFGIIDLGSDFDPRRITILPSDADAAAPEVSNVSPEPGSALPRLSALLFDVTDTSNAIRRAFVWVAFDALGTSEVAHDGDDFAPLYATSSRASITDGHRYTLRRTGGWPSAPTLHVEAIDVAGNEAT